MLYVSGKVNPTKVLKKLKKAGKAAEIVWVSTGGAAYSYYEDPTSSYNYYNNNPYMNNDYMNNGYGLMVMVMVLLSFLQLLHTAIIIISFI